MRAFFQGRITLRHLRVLVEGLPPGGALGRAASRSPWGTTEYLLAELIDRIGRLETDFRNANRSEKTAAQPYPDPVWRPGDPTPAQKAKAEAKAAREARQGYQRIVAIATPQHTEKG
ncbi:hypothetical protein ACIOHC_41300 [Streptomyces sp. NPDC088252]|uniref:hypothetical protein n=1 Tax=unclassified Streptomyces TaxID=2593676 RepID=UPI00341CCF3B